MKIIKRRLFYDIETSFNQGWFFTAGYKQNINYEQITVERAVISICYKWEGEKTIHSLAWKNGNDKKLLIDFLKIADSADELVAHNGDKFDLAFIKTRCAKHGISCSPLLKTIDTYKIAKSHFRFNSNRLDYIGKFFGFGGKVSTGGYRLWFDVVIKKDEAALLKMIKYNKGDVRLLENVFNKLKPYIRVKTHYGVLNGKDRPSCPECGASDRQIVNQHRVSAAGTKTTQLKCAHCGTTHQVPTKQLSKTNNNERQRTKTQRRKNKV
jgi:DNA polymerase III epsilon subunit-like protein